MSPLWMFWFFECEVSADVCRRVNQSSAMTSHSIILMPVWAEHVRLAEGCWSRHPATSLALTFPKSISHADSPLCFPRDWLPRKLRCR